MFGLRVYNIKLFDRNVIQKDERLSSRMAVAVVKLSTEATNRLTN